MRMSTNDYEFDIRETSFTCQSSFNTFLTLFGEKLNLLLIKKIRKHLNKALMTRSTLCKKTDKDQAWEHHFNSKTQRDQCVSTYT